MAPLVAPSLYLLILTTILILFTSNTRAQHKNVSLQMMTEALELSTDISDDDGFGVSEEEYGDAIDGITMEGRSLYWRYRRHRYYISYAALSANRVPCPPRSGRSYYTRNCHKASGPVRPYYRGCSAITRCARTL